MPKCSAINDKNALDDDGKHGSDSFRNIFRCLAKRIFCYHATVNCTLFSEFLDLTEKIITWMWFVCVFAFGWALFQTMPSDDDFRIFNQVNWLNI